MKLSKFIKECQEHSVLKNLSIYVVSSWVILQVIALIAEPLGFSPRIVAYCLIALLIGFPLYILGVWKYQLAPSIKRKPLLDAQGNPVPGKFMTSNFQRLYFTFLGIVGLTCISIALFITYNNVSGPGVRPVWDGSDKIAVLRFKNRMLGDTARTNVIGDMAVDWIIHGITRNNLAQVISPDIVEDYSKVLRDHMQGSDSKYVLTEYLKPSKIIEGDYFQDGDQLIFQCAIRDEVMDKTLISFRPVTCNSNAPLDCIEALNQRILGYFIFAEKEADHLEARPPRFEAYQTFRKALAWQHDDDRIYLDSLESAIQKDPDYFEPKIYRFMYYYNIGEFHVADSLLKELRLNTGMFARQRSLLNLYGALLAGDHRSAYRYQREEYNITPFHLETNSNMMIFSLQFVNRPEAVDSIYRQIDMADVDLSKCNSCIERYKIQAMAQIELGKLQEAITLLTNPAKLNFERVWILKKILIRAHIRAGNFDQALSLLEALIPPKENPALLPETLLSAAKDFLRVGEVAPAASILEQAIAGFQKKEVRDYSPALSDYRLGESYFYKDSYAEALPYLQQGYASDSLDFNYGALYAISLAKTGREEEAAGLLEAMQGKRAEFQFGELYYSLAQYHAAMGQQEACLENLIKAIADGHWYETDGFQNDPLLRDYLTTEGFQRAMTYWQ